MLLQFSSSGLIQSSSPIEDRVSNLIGVLSRPGGAGNCFFSVKIDNKLLIGTSVYSDLDSIVAISETPSDPSKLTNPGEIIPIPSPFGDSSDLLREMKGSLLIAIKSILCENRCFIISEYPALASSRVLAIKSLIPLEINPFPKKLYFNPFVPLRFHKYLNRPCFVGCEKIIGIPFYSYNVDNKSTSSEFSLTIPEESMLQSIENSSDEKIRETLHNYFIHLFNLIKKNFDGERVNNVLTLEPYNVEFINYWSRSRNFSKIATTNNEFPKVSNPLPESDLETLNKEVGSVMGFISSIFKNENPQIIELINCGISKEKIEKFFNSESNDDFWDVLDKIIENDIKEGIY